MRDSEGGCKFVKVVGIIRIVRIVNILGIACIESKQALGVSKVVG